MNPMYVNDGDGHRWYYVGGGLFAYRNERDKSGLQVTYTFIEAQWGIKSLSADKVADSDI